MYNNIWDKQEISIPLNQNTKKPFQYFFEKCKLTLPLVFASVGSAV